MANYLSAFLSPTGFFDYDPLARPNMTTHEKELAEARRLADLDEARRDTPN